MGEEADGRLIKRNFITVSVYLVKSCTGLAFRLVGLLSRSDPKFFRYCRIDSEAWKGGEQEAAGGLAQPLE